MTVIERIKHLTESLSDEERRSLAAYLASHGTGENRQPRDLYGIWKDRFPKDFDLDSALREIRGEWQKEIQEIAP